MNPKPIERAKDPLLAKGLPALRRARQRAEEVARETNTALIQVIDGEIVRVYPDSREDVGTAPKPSR
jgi:hypothetical protein